MEVVVSSLSQRSDSLLVGYKEKECYISYMITELMFGGEIEY